MWILADLETTNVMIIVLPLWFASTACGSAVWRRKSGYVDLTQTFNSAFAVVSLLLGTITQRGGDLTLSDVEPQIYIFCIKVDT